MKKSDKGFLSLLRLHTTVHELHPGATSTRGSLDTILTHGTHINDHGTWSHVLCVTESIICKHGSCQVEGRDVVDVFDPSKHDLKRIPPERRRSG